MKATKLVATLLSVLFVLTSVLSVSVFADEESAPAAPAVWDGTVDTSWYDAESTSKDVTLTTPAQLAGFSQLSQTNNFLNWTIRLGADMVLNTGDAAEWGTTAPANAWTPIGEFWGIFDGQGYTVSGMYIMNKAKAEIGFFASLNGGIVRNVSFVNSYVVGYRQVGTVAGIIKTVFGKISNVYSDAYVYAYNCEGTVSDGSQAGGILGANATELSEINACWFDGEVYGIADPGETGLANDNKATQVGGIVGVSTQPITVKDCLVTAKITGHSQIGGVVGRFIGASGQVVENCLVLPKEMVASRWTPNTVFAGEFVGIAFNGLSITIKNCYGLNTYSVTYPLETMTDANKVNKTATHSSNGTVTLTEDSHMDRFAEADLQGDSATSKLVGFDFTNVWKTVEGATPVIASLEYIAEHKTSGQAPKDPTDPGDKPTDTDTNTDTDTDPATPGTPEVPTDTKAPTTNEKPTDTKAPATDEKPADTSGAPADEKTGGCASSIGGIALIVLLSVGAAGMIGRKKKN